MTKKNHHYDLYIVDDKAEKMLINGRPIKHCKNLEEIFEKDPKAVIRVIWPNMKNNNTKKKTTRRSS